MEALVSAALPAPSALLAIGAALFWRHKHQGSAVLRAVTALGWIGVCSLPVALCQVGLAASGSLSTSFGAQELLTLLLVGWWVLAGGASVIALFEASLAALGAGRSATLLDHLPWFWLLLAIQWALLVWLLLPCFGARFRWTHKRLWLIGGAVALNAALGLGWPWWGT